MSVTVRRSPSSSALARRPAGGARSVSSAPCRMMTAAAWSTTLAARPEPNPALTSPRCAHDRGEPLVDQPHADRSAAVASGQPSASVGRRRGGRPGLARTGERQPDDAPRPRPRSRTSPTSASRSRVGARSRRASPPARPARLRVASRRPRPGRCRRRPRAATPGRTPRGRLTRSRARRGPPRCTAASASSAASGLAPPPCATSSLPPPPPPSAPAATRTRSPARSPRLAPGVVDRDDDHRPAVRRATSDAPRPAPPRPAADVEREPAQVVGAGAVAAPGGRRRRHRRRRPGSAASPPARGEHLARRAASRAPSPPRAAARPAPATRSGSSSRARLQLLGELGDQDVLAGQEPVGVGADQRLDPPHAGADRRLAEQLDHAELAGARGVGAAAQLAGVVADLDTTRTCVAVLLAEQRHRADRAGPRPAW